MRDNPPTPFLRSSDHAKPTDGSVHVGSDTVLNADDMGMLMLHIHHLKTILWKDRRRFSPSIIRSVAEDLAELAGERGMFFEYGFIHFLIFLTHHGPTQER
jgi:hypothetical protein